jgi:Cytochrome P460
MNGASRTTVVAAIPLGSWSYALGGTGDGQIRFPEDFRTWAHVKRVLIGPDSSFFVTDGGIHHIYANRIALEGYRTGTFPADSIIVSQVG